MDVIIVCHTEYGFVNNKKIVIFDKEHIEGVEKGVWNLLDISKKYSAKITFAVMPEVVRHFPKDIGHEIGLHIHPGWDVSNYGVEEHIIGDKYLREKCSQSSNSSALWDYPYEEQLNMIKAGKEYLLKELGVETRVFVSGRWSENNDTIKALIETGFTHDCSPIPRSKTDHFDWSGLPRICMPYHPSREDYQKEGDLTLLIIPVSRMWFKGIVNPESASILGLQWLKACFLEYYSQGLPLFHICLHSPSMTDTYLISVMDELMAFIVRHNIKFKFASEIKKYPQLNPKTKILLYLFSINKNLVRTSFKRILL